MIFEKTTLEGAYLIDLEKKGDERGFFARAFCQKEFSEHGLVSQFVQVNNSLSGQKGTLRGMHYQLPPFSEVKVLRCIKGSLFDVIVDLRSDSPTFKKWFGAELTAENRRMMYVPQGFAHGLITLEDNTEVLYLVSAFYSQENERGLRFDDPTIGIHWPMIPTEVSVKDRQWPDLNEEFHGLDRLMGLR